MKYFIVIIYLFVAVLGNAQDQRLANRYYSTGEYEKAAISYKKLHIKSPHSTHYFERYVSSLIEMEDYKGAENAIKKQLKKKKNNLALYVMLGKLMERQEDNDGAQKQYEKAIRKLKNNPNSTSQVANLFIREAKYKLALKAYEEGLKYVENPNRYAYNLGDLYWRIGDKEKSIEQFINSLDAKANRLSSLKTFFHRNLDDDGFKSLITILYQRIVAAPEKTKYAELLQWCFVTKKQYAKALRQAKGIDGRLEENGTRVYKLGMTAFRDKDYKTAINAFQYIGENKNKNTRYYLEAKHQLLHARREIITENPNYTTAELTALSQEYVTFLDEYGRNNQTANILIEYAKLNAIYMGDHKQAIEILNQLIDLQNIKPDVMAEAKLALGDYYVIDGKVWEATLLYSQVDKAFKEADLGERARFKNAKLSYYNGDFKWAQEQFDFLKSATSKLISNDAIDLSVFITDNLGMDSTETAMKMYAAADLLVFQNKFKEAMSQLDKMKSQFPKHSLYDDILYTKAQIYLRQKEVSKAIEMYELIVDKYPEEIRADNALFELADIYQNYLSDDKKAIELYEKLFIDYSGSTFAVEARKRYRRLRGDGVQ